MSQDSRSRIDRFWLLLLILPPLLILPNLGNTFLWQDEAETALLGRSVARHGLPVAHDGRRTISDQPGAPDVSEDGLWIWTPWLQHYAVAGSFALFGESNATARLPFALAGWGTILASYGFFRAIAQRLLTARLAVLLLATSVPFLLQVRQCRYYAWVPLFVVLHLWGDLRLARSQRGGAPLLTLAGLGLFFTLLPQLVVSTLAVLADALFRRNRRLLAPVLACSAVVALLSAPYFLYTQGWSRDYLGLGHGYDSPARYAATLRAYLIAVQIYAWPFLWAGVALLASSRDLRPELGRPGRALAVIAPIVFVIAATAPPSAASFAALFGISIVAFAAG
ncbi:MAG: glycosyltransferase family 39 protein, partial [Myxococcota bacterium]